MSVLEPQIPSSCAQLIRDEIRRSINSDPGNWRWLWRSSSYAGHFADPYLENTSLDRGGFLDTSITTLSQVVRRLLLVGLSNYVTGITHEQTSKLCQVLDCLDYASDFSRRLGFTSVKRANDVYLMEERMSKPCSKEHVLAEMVQEVLEEAVVSTQSTGVSGYLNISRVPRAR
eukprot:TRINITY_DN7721_c0_g1_i20.p1 TRINITY_DN7721_c0_g1~~TRINITY_DN7721_c0_g1_i20.p1  ORF type:complete len:173 (-),score=33.86 TRINITY_DN7721_c0_g1_i20:768-1286(-)